MEGEGSTVKMQVGTKWAGLKCTGIELVESRDGAITELVRVYQLVCECGERLEVREDLWPGKRLLKSCGKSGCTYKQPVSQLLVELRGEGEEPAREKVARQGVLKRPPRKRGRPKVKPGTRKRSYTVVMMEGVWEWLIREGEKDGRTPSQVVNDWVEEKYREGMRGPEPQEPYQGEQEEQEEQGEQEEQEESEEQ